MNKANRILLLIAGVAGAAVIYYLLILPARKNSAKIRITEAEADAIAIENEKKREAIKEESLRDQATLYFNRLNAWADAFHARRMDEHDGGSPKKNKEKPQWKKWFNENFWYWPYTEFVIPNPPPAGFKALLTNRMVNTPGIALIHEATGKTFKNPRKIQYS